MGYKVMRLMSNPLEVHESVLNSLSKKESVKYDGEEYNFVDKRVIVQSHGYFMDELIFGYDGKLYGCAMIKDDHDGVVFTVPHEVLREDKTYTRTVYTNYIEEDGDESGKWIRESCD